VIDVVIPTLNEAPYLPALLADLGKLRTTLPLDVVVADGGSTDDTPGCAERSGARLVRAPRGRARQLNAGAAVATGDWLLFLHADSRLHVGARRTLLAAIVDDSDLQAAVFRFAIDLPRAWKRFIELGQTLRERLTGLRYGDQGLLIHRELFRAVGGFADMPIMEDVAMLRSIRRQAVRARTLPAELLTSGRRYRAHGVLRTWLANVLLITLYLMGVPTRQLARWRAG
jgi:rSAM/selenodomain-associated transferase 2